MRVLIVACMLLCGCGYHVRESGSATLGVPYVAGDTSGHFTAALIHKIASNPQLSFSQNGDFCLKVCLMEPGEENIGFKYAPEKHGGGLSKILSPEEGRLALAATCTLVDRNAGQVVFGPFVVSAKYCYDFESDFSNVNIHNFSLSQLEMHTLARDEAVHPLHTLLAQKIVDTLAASW